MRIGGADTWDAQERQRVDAVEVKADVVGELLPSCCSSCWRADIVWVTYEAIAVGAAVLRGALLSEVLPASVACIGCGAGELCGAKA